MQGQTMKSVVLAIIFTITLAISTLAHQTPQQREWVTPTNLRVGDVSSVLICPGAQGSKNLFWRKPDGTWSKWDSDEYAPGVWRNYYTNQHPTKGATCTLKTSQVTKVSGDGVEFEVISTTKITIK